MPLRRLSFLLALFLTGCGGEPEPLEAQIETLVAAGEAAGEAKDIDALLDLIADNYAGPRGESKRNLKSFALFTFARNAAIHLYTRIAEIETLGPQTARVAVFVAMGGRPITGPEDVEGLRGSLWRFDLFVHSDGDEARVTQAQWRRAQPTDFF